MTFSFKTVSVSAAAAVALLVAGCSSGSANPGQQSESGSGSENAVNTAPAGFERYYSQEIDWQNCDPSQVVPALVPEPSDMSPYECATVIAPMNWDDPNSAEIELSVARYLGPKMSEDNPPLFYNLGGPGGAAVANLNPVVTNILTQDLADKSQVVALDPRGVGESSPIWCMTDEERDVYLSETFDTEGLSTEELVVWYDAETAKLGEQCLERNGEILGFVDSDSAARDFDMVRAAMGANTIDYIGFSYGTVLGANYAELFPEQVGHFVLDGAVDPSVSINELSALQIEGMEKALYNWIETCQAESNCPLDGDLESGKQQMISFLESVNETPISTADPDRPLDGPLARTAIIGSLYSTNLYPLLKQGVSQAMSGDGSTMLFLADYYNDRGDDGVFTSNSSDAFVAVNMLDYSPVGTPDEWQEALDDLEVRFPVLGSDFGFASAGMDSWPVKGRVQRHKVTASGAGEILVIGTTNDPATPYVMSQSLAQDLEGGILITVEGWDHTAYNREASSCLITAVDQFLLNGTLPENDLTCEGN